MASTIKVDKLDPQSGTALEIGTSGDTVTVPSGVGLTLTDSTLLLPTTIQTDKLDPKSGTALEIGSSGDTITIPSGATITNSGTATGFGGGKIGQVLQTVNTGTETLSSTTPTTIPNFTVSITPAATSSKVLVMVNTQIQCTNNHTLGFSLYRDTTELFIADAAGSRDRLSWSWHIRTDARKWAMASISYLDSPSSTSELDYSCKWLSQASAAMYMNRTAGDGDYANYDNRTASSITVMEVLA